MVKTAVLHSRLELLFLSTRLDLVKSCTLFVLFSGELGLETEDCDTQFQDLDILCSF